MGREEDKANRFGAIGEKIAKKCDGLPLAARALGALMHSKRKRGEWEDVLESKIWVLKEVEQQVFQPLLLSYYELAPVIKRCLLYCDTFPKDYRMSKHNLIEMWMSQDYLSGKGYKEKEKTSQTVFETLVMRSFLQDVVEDKLTIWDESITIFCKMHDIVHDFVQFLNKNECFIMEAKEANGRISEEVRHLSLMHAPYGSPLSDFISAVNCKKLRTLAAFESRMLHGSDLKAITLVKCLRTLNLRDTAIDELPEEMGELIYLRLPENMGNLINLRHVHTEGCHELEYLPRGMARLTSLQTLNQCPIIDGEGLKLGDLGSLDQLQGSLTIKIMGRLEDAVSEAQMACLWNKKLFHLNLFLSHLEDAQDLEALRPHQHLETLSILGYGGSTAPSWMISLQNLRSLVLYMWNGCESLPPLGNLPFLEQLDVAEMDKMKRVRWRCIFGHSNILILLCFIP
ncbi:putative disease resistance protein RGA1 [Argentina anserina]|uniref:putative disease resistance protein RGA1 n=1 Tax=Argentina anserina TaxID=57926 RepID=UPI0021768BB0|nr:putative disease resistance protein RGA1 [Potentilla anserina]